MKDKALFILRLGLGLTFIGIGYMILQNPLGWAGFLDPWIANLLPISAERIMFTTAIFDIILGAWLIVGFKKHISGLLASIHLFIVMISIGFNPASIRDIGLFASALFLTLYFWPQKNNLK